MRRNLAEDDLCHLFFHDRASSANVSVHLFATLHAGNGTLYEGQYRHDKEEYDRRDAPASSCI